MTTSTRILLVLVGLRLLLPPGICACKLSSPVSKLVAYVAGGDAPPAAPEDEDHHAGCPASALALGLGVKPASPVLDEECTSAVTPAPFTKAPAPVLASDPFNLPTGFFNAPPIYVCHCALLC